MMPNAITRLAKLTLLICLLTIAAKLRAFSGPGNLPWKKHVRNHGSWCRYYTFADLLIILENKIVVKTMRRILSCLLFALVVTAPSLLKAQVQQISYTEPEREDGRRTNFEIIGKVNGNYLVFKNNNSSSAVSIYD